VWFPGCRVFAKTEGCVSMAVLAVSLSGFNADEGLKSQPLGWLVI